MNKMTAGELIKKLKAFPEETTIEVDFMYGDGAVLYADHNICTIIMVKKPLRR